jgi:hypothetical protein
MTSLAVILVGVVKDLPSSPGTSDDTASLKRDGGNAMESDDSNVGEDKVGNLHGERVKICATCFEEPPELNAS